MTTTTAPLAERPAAGKLPRIGVGINDTYVLARQGQGDTAIIEGLIARREKLANELHYRLIKLGQEFDAAARQLEGGRRQYVLSRNNWYAELPIQIEMLDDASRQVEEAQGLQEYASRTTPESAAYRLEQAAHALDMTVEAANPTERIEHPLAAQLRAEAAQILADEAARKQRERDEREHTQERERARRVARPLGKTERKMLERAASGPLTVGRWTLAGEQKAMKSLEERGLLTEARHNETLGRHRLLTEAGRALVITA